MRRATCRQRLWRDISAYPGNDLIDILVAICDHFSFFMPMTDFDYPGFYDFETTDNFLQSILGAAQSLSPDSINGDEKKMNEWLMNLDTNLPVERPSVPEMPPLTGFQSSSMSSSSYSQDSNVFGGMTPESQDTTYSNKTSPHYVKKEIEAISIGKQDMLNDESVSPEERKPSIKGASKVTKPGRKDKVSHNQIERKYRTNINTKILALRDAVPSLRIAAGCNDVSVADLEGLTPASKLNKASVLDKATEYIRHLERKNETLMIENRNLQRLIQEASLNPRPVVSQGEPSSAGRHNGFGFAPVQSYNTTPVANYSQPAVPATNEAYQQQPPNKFLLGGMAAMVGTSLFSGDLEFKNLSAIPIFPQALASPISFQLWRLLKIALVMLSLASILQPYLTFGTKEKSKSQNTEGFSQLMVHLGVKLPSRIKKDYFNELTTKLAGKSDSFTSWSLLSNYFSLSSKEVNFESCILSLIIGSIFCSKHPIAGRILSINLKLKAMLIKNLDYSGENKSLLRLYKLIKNVDGLTMFTSPEFVDRLANLAYKRPINEGSTGGPSHLKYIEYLQDNSDDYFGIVLSWRVLELLHQLEITFLESISDDDRETSMKAILRKTEGLQEIIESCPQGSKLKKHFVLFKSIISPQHLAVSLMADLERDVQESLKEFGSIETLDSDSSIGEVDLEDASIETTTAKKTLLEQKALIDTLNVISEEQFLVLVCSLAIYYKDKDLKKGLELLKYLNFATDKPPLSMLSFTAVLRVIDELSSNVVENRDEENATAVLDQLVRVARFWINDRASNLALPQELCANLSDWIVEKGIVLNGMELRDEEE